MQSLYSARAEIIFIRKKLGHTAVSAIKASSVTLYIWQMEPGEKCIFFFTKQSLQRLTEAKPFLSDCFVT